MMALNGIMQTFLQTMNQPLIMIIAITMATQLLAVLMLMAQRLLVLLQQSETMAKALLAQLQMLP